MDIDAESRVCPICSYEFSESFGVTRLVAILLLAGIIGYMILQWLG